MPEQNRAGACHMLNVRACMEWSIVCAVLLTVNARRETSGRGRRAPLQPLVFPSRVPVTLHLQTSSVVIVIVWFWFCLSLLGKVNDCPTLLCLHFEGRISMGLRNTSDVDPHPSLSSSAESAVDLERLPESDRTNNKSPS